MRRGLAIAACAAAVAAAAPTVTTASVPAAVPTVTTASVSAAAAAPSVTTMVVGKERVLAGPRAVTAKQARMKVAGHRCAVGRATPLAALARLGLRVGLRDYGACGRRPADAGGLFVKRVGPDRNRGRDGWVYKVGRRVGTAGAADPAGPFGTGRRLRGGDRVLWFWCDTLRTGGCQRTLEVVPERTAAAPGEALRVTVRGYDDTGRGKAVSAATVRLGDASAQTGPDGVATLTMPGAGRLELIATAEGMVRSFPREVTAG